MRHKHHQPSRKKRDKREVEDLRTSSGSAEKDITLKHRRASRLCTHKIYVVVRNEREVERERGGERERESLSGRNETINITRHTYLQITVLFFF